MLGLAEGDEILNGWSVIWGFQIIIRFSNPIFHNSSIPIFQQFYFDSKY
jgi:hypothetical protein